jgi:hypothetical protein
MRGLFRLSRSRRQISAPIADIIAKMDLTRIAVTQLDGIGPRGNA